jgi:predicted alpha/beta hydrolase family esterase
MRTADIDILMVPGWGNSGPEHWQSRWQGRLPTASRVEQADWEHALLGPWTERIIAAVNATRRPCVILAHSLGVLAVGHAAKSFTEGKVAGAFLVAPPGSTAVLDIEGIDNHFAHPPRHKLPFRSVLVASRNDHYCPILEAEELAVAWGSEFVDAGDAGHINTDSGHGPWPEGLMRLAGFLKSLG